MRKLFTVIIATVMATFLTSCSKKEPPKCSDENTIGLAKKIILKEIGGLEGYATEKEIQENIKIELPRASALDENIQKYSCEARLVAAESYQVPITYSSQLDDKGEHIVSVAGIRDGDMRGIQMGLLQSIVQNRPKKSAISPPQEQAPAASTVQNISGGIPQASMVQETSSGGTLRIVKKEKEFYGSNILFNNKPILPEDVMDLEFVKKYRVGNDDVIVTYLANGANGVCPVEYFFISVSSANLISISPSISCHAEAELNTSQDQSKITGVISKLKGSGNDVYVFEKGVLMENGKILQK